LVQVVATNLFKVLELSKPTVAVVVSGLVLDSKALMVISCKSRAFRLSLWASDFPGLIKTVKEIKRLGR
jgi:hypothetical protein